MDNSLLVAADATAQAAAMSNAMSAVPPQVAVANAVCRSHSIYPIDNIVFMGEFGLLYFV